MNTEEVIKGLSQHFFKLNIDFFLIGAKARDLIAETAGVAAPRRKTSDVDFGVLIDSAEVIDSLRESYKHDPNIKLSSDTNKIRYFYKEAPFDLVPFGGVAKDGKVSWPPFYDTIMTVIGYEEALKCSKVLTIGSTQVKVITPEMLVALKLVSWEENPSRQRDAQDIDYILSRYESIEPGAYEEVLDRYAELLEEFDHDSSLATIALMGVRIQNDTSLEHVRIIKELLSSQSKMEKLSREMIPASTLVENYEELCFAKLQALLIGLNLKL